MADSLGNKQDVEQPFREAPLRVIRRAEELASLAQRPHFTGDVSFVGDLLGSCNEALQPQDTLHLVRFAEGAANDWHTHSSRQILIFTEGRGFVEVLPESLEGQEGQSGGSSRILREELRAGDLAIIAPGIVHRHGAVSDSSAAHLAIQSGEAMWLENRSPEALSQ
jgi:quercetin dioxygenase-like cupin family protein